MAKRRVKRSACCQVLRGFYRVSITSNVELSFLYLFFLSGLKTERFEIKKLFRRGEYIKNLKNCDGGISAKTHLSWKAFLHAFYRLSENTNANQNLLSNSLVRVQRSDNSWGIPDSLENEKITHETSRGHLRLQISRGKENIHAH